MDNDQDKVVKPSTKVDIKGGTYFSGDVTIGGGAFIGRDNISFGDFSGGSTEDRDEFMQLLQKIEKELEMVRDQLPEEEAEDIVYELKDLQEMANKPQPDSRRMSRKLRNLASIVDIAPTRVARKLMPLIKQAKNLVQGL